MKRTFKISTMLMSLAVLFASCLGDGDEDIVYYSDAAILSFTVTNFNTYHTTKSSKGEDSVYVVREKGDNYKFYIDQTNNEIYNRDSLPIGTDIKHILCTVLTARSSSPFIKSIRSDSISSFRSTDSLDFSKPRVIKVVSIDGLYERTYNVRVNVHQQLPDEFRWTHMGYSEIFSEADDLKLVSRDEDLVMFVKKGSVTEVYRTTSGNAAQWGRTSAAFDAEAYKNAIVFDGRFYVKSEGKVYRSDDAETWTEVCGSAEIDNLLGCDRNNMYALSAKAMLKSADGGITWNAEDSDDSLELMPREDISFLTYPLKTNRDIDRLVVVGNSGDASVSDAYVWNKLSEYTEPSENHRWNFVEQTDALKFRLPQLRGLQVINYDEGMLAIGGESYNGAVPAYSQIYYSVDGGITWLKDKRFELPLNFNTTEKFTMTVDKSNHIWIVCTGSGTIWRGRLNGLGWEIR